MSKCILKYSNCEHSQIYTITILMQCQHTISIGIFEAQLGIICIIV